MEGTVRPVNPLVADDLVQIGCQAIVNAFQHAGATKIQVRLHYKPTELRLEVNDDGSGMSERVAEFGKPGHYGLIGMRERAGRVGGTLTLPVSQVGHAFNSLCARKRAYRVLRKHD